MYVPLVSLKNRLPPHETPDHCDCRVEHRHRERYEGNSNGDKRWTFCGPLHRQPSQEESGEHAAGVTQK